MSDYPTDEQLAHLEAFTGTARQYVDAVKELWWPDGNGITVTQASGDRGDAHIEVRLATGGWSGNEEIMAVVKDTLFHFMFWQVIKRGGLFVYHVPLWAWESDTIINLGSPRELAKQEKATVS